jgi:hypothetical protein
VAPLLNEHFHRPSTAGIFRECQPKIFDLNEKGTREEKESDELDLNICAHACVLGSHKEIIFLCHRCGWRRSKIEIKK